MKRRLWLLDADKPDGFLTFNELHYRNQRAERPQCPIRHAGSVKSPRMLGTLDTLAKFQGFARP